MKNLSAWLLPLFALFSWQLARGDWRQKFSLGLFSPYSLVAGQAKEVGSPTVPMPSILGRDSTDRGSGEK